MLQHLSYMFSHIFSPVSPTSLNIYNSCLCLRSGSRTAGPSAVSSSSRVAANPSPVLPKRRLLQYRNPVPQIRSRTHPPPTALPLLSPALAWPWAPALETLLFPSGAQPYRPYLTPWPPHRPPACSGPHLIPWAMASRPPTARAMPAPLPTSLA